MTPGASTAQVLSIVHETCYRYERPVQHSSHLFRLRPIQDATQQVLEHTLQLAPEGERWESEDMFGNHVTHFEVASPYTTLRIASRARVRVLALPALDPAASPTRLLVPLAWDRAAREPMMPYLAQPDLPPAHLRELVQYAMGVAERNDYDLTATLLDLTKTIQRDYQYEKGATSVETTAYEAYVQRRGVCQDFANLLICFARGLEIPARYRVGYICTGGDYEHHHQSEASHAWVECYVPWHGWRGFDPTNGCLTGVDHVRVAAGRNYRDATPTSGTIHAGGGGEVLEVSVRVERREERPAETGARKSR